MRRRAKTPQARYWWAKVALFALFCLSARPLFAHVSERALVLLLPTGFYTIFGMAAVVLTLILTVLLPPRTFHRLIPRTQAKQAALAPKGRGLSLAVFLLFTGLIALGFLGPHDPLENLLPLTIFTLWWIILPLAQALFGDIWDRINPWSGPLWLLFRGRHLVAMPTWLGHWPALLTYLLISLFALTDIAPMDPDRLAWVAGGYWLFTFTMGAIFGPQWLRRGEGYSLFFHLIARLSPLRKRCFPGSDIVNAPRPHISVAVFAVTLLAVGSFDGLHETFWWMGQIGINPLAFPGRSAVAIQNQIGLLGAVAALNLGFAACVWGGLVLISKASTFPKVFPKLALTLLPIAVGYHFAHYLTSALVNLQYVAVAVNDPLENGADLIGLSGFYVTTGFFSQHTIVTWIWLSQALAIVLAHMIAVTLSHAIALREFSNHKAAVLSQFPVALFMVAYTYFGLWLLSSPVAL